MVKDLKNIVLVGFMGSGKSTIANLLAKELGHPVMSTDEMIVRAEKRPIADIFRDSGESYFRQVEKRIVLEAAKRSGCIIDCGGGVVLDPENISCLKLTGIMFYLTATPQEIFQRVKSHSHRPLLNTENPRAMIEELLAKRSPFYTQADFQIDTTAKKPQVICQEIVRVMEARGDA